MRLRSVVDGQQVDIPVPLMHDKDIKEGRKRLVWLADGNASLSK